MAENRNSSSADRKITQAFLGIIAALGLTSVGLLASGALTPTKVIKSAHTKTIVQTIVQTKAVKAPTDGRVYGDNGGSPAKWYYYDLGGQVHDIYFTTHDGRKVECIEDTTQQGSLACNWKGK